MPARLQPRLSYAKVVATLVVAFLAAPAVAQATTFTVTRRDDPSPGACAASDCSLREAVRAANAGSGGDRIVLPAGLYRLRDELTRRVNVAIAPNHINAVLFKEIVIQ